MHLNENKVTKPQYISMIRGAYLRTKRLPTKCLGTSEEIQLWIIKDNHKVRDTPLSITEKDIGNVKEQAASYKGSA